LYRGRPCRHNSAGHPSLRSGQAPARLTGTGMREGKGDRGLGLLGRAYSYEMEITPLSFPIESDSISS